MNDYVLIPCKLWNYIYAVLWEASNWTPNKRYFKQMIRLKAMDLRPEIDAIQAAQIAKESGGEAMTWGDIYTKWLAKGVDHGFAAHKADLWEKRRDRKIKQLKQEVTVLRSQPPTQD